MRQSIDFVLLELVPNLKKKKKKTKKKKTKKEQALSTIKEVISKNQVIYYYIKMPVANKEPLTSRERGKK